MSIFQDGYADVTGDGSSPTALEKLVREKWPNCGEVLFGVRDEVTGDFVVKPHKVLYWAEGEYLKYCLSCPTTRTVAFGSIGMEEVRLGALERSLAAKDYEWKPSKRR
jgi:hypothetical protein